MLGRQNPMTFRWWTRFALAFPSCPADFSPRLKREASLRWRYQRTWTLQHLRDALGKCGFVAYGVFHSHGGTPKWMVFNGKSPNKNGWELGVALFQETPIGSEKSLEIHLVFEDKAWAICCEKPYVHWRRIYHDFPIQMVFLVLNICKPPRKTMVSGCFILGVEEKCLNTEQDKDTQSNHAALSVAHEAQARYTEWPLRNGEAMESLMSSYFQDSVDEIREILG